MAGALEELRARFLQAVEDGLRGATPAQVRPRLPPPRNHP